ncbi:Nnf1-domain-containing protein [Sarocladium strictum]
MAASRPSREPSADPTQQLQSEQAQAQSTAQAPATSEQATEPAQAEPASPPLPERHTAVTPGPRAQRFQELFAQSLKRTLGKAGWENFKDCYPTVAKSSEGTLKQVQAQMVAKLGEKCEREFESIMVNRQVVPKLNELESLIAEAATRRTSSSGPEPTPYVSCIHHYSVSKAILTLRIPQTTPPPSINNPLRPPPPQPHPPLR